MRVVCSRSRRIYNSGKNQFIWHSYETTTSPREKTACKDNLPICLISHSFAHWESRGHVSVADELLMFSYRSSIPKSIRLRILDCILTGHLGIPRCRSRTSTAKALKASWGLCCPVHHLCQRSPTPKEPLTSASFPSRYRLKDCNRSVRVERKVYLIVMH